MQLCKLRFTLPVSFDPLYFVAEEEYLTTNLQTWNGDFFFPARAWEVCRAGINSYGDDFVQKILMTLIARYYY